MSEEWIIRVYDREYGPVDLETLREWKREGRVLPTNQARKVDVDVWVTAAEIPGLSETAPPLPIETAEVAAHRSLAKIFTQTFRIYGKGFFQIFALTLLVIGPSVCAQLTRALIEAAPNVEVDLRTVVEDGFAFCMLLLFLALSPIYIAGIQILSSELAAGRRIGFLRILNEAVKFWPRVAFLWIFVCLCYVFWTVLLVGVILTILLSGLSLPSIFLALALLVLWVWIIGRLWINFLFWQQFAVLGGCDAAESLRQSKQLARSGRERVWFRRPMWRGVFIASLWFAVVLAINWPFVAAYFRTLAVATDPQSLMEALRSGAKSSTSNLSLGLSFLQAALKPLLGIAFVLLYLDAKGDFER